MSDSPLDVLDGGGANKDLGTSAILADSPSQPGGSSGSSFANIGGGTSFPGVVAGDRLPVAAGPIGSAPVIPVTVSAVPEPTTWLLMISGFGLLGIVLRRRRNDGAKGHRAKPGQRRPASPKAWRSFGLLSLMGSSGPAFGGAAGVVIPAQAVARTTVRSAVLAKAAMCVCPTALLVGAAATVPPIKSAIYSATAPKAEKLNRIPTAAMPCADDSTSMWLNDMSKSDRASPAKAPSSSASANASQT